MRRVATADEGSAESPGEATEDCRRLLRRAFIDGEREHSSLAFLSWEIFSRRALALVRRRAARSGERRSSDFAPRMLERIAAADLYLALACDEGVDGAWRVLTSRYESRLCGLAVRRGVSAADADELVANLLGDLIAEPGRTAAASRLATYEGTGTLWSWLSVILVRRLAERAAQREAESAAPAGADSAPASSQPAEEEETRASLRPVLSAAWEELPDREALALLYKYRDGLSQKRIARLFGVGEPRVSRILGSAVKRLRSELGPRLGLLTREATDGTWETLRDLLGERLQECKPRPDPLVRRRERERI